MEERTKVNMLRILLKKCLRNLVVSRLDRYRGSRVAKTTRSKILLSLQKALLGRVFPALRVVAVERTDNTVKIWAYVDGPIFPNEKNTLSTVVGKVEADLGTDTEVDFAFVRIDYPNLLPLHQDWVYCRQEGGSR